MKTYFLSYARADQTVALRFADDLIAAGVSVWVDQYDIRPSQHWDRAVEMAVRGCQGLLVMLSPRSVASANVADEVSVAIDGGKDVIPVMIEACTLPLRMTRMQFIDATRDYPGALRKCLDAITRSSGEQAAADTSPAPGASPLDPDVVRAAERRLTGVMGPIAAVLVKAAEAQATSEPDLYRRLAASIADSAERESFLGWAPGPADATPAPPAASSPTLPASDIPKIIAALTRQLGPIAPHIVDQEQKSAGSAQELCQRLAARIPEGRDRAAFLKEVEVRPA